MARHFDGSDDYSISTSDADIAGTDFSIGLWYKTGDSTTGGCIVGVDGEPSGGQDYGTVSLYCNYDSSFSVNSGHFAVYMRDTRVSGSKDVDFGTASATSPNLSDGNWHHILVTRSGTNTIALYADGTDVTDVSGANDLVVGQLSAPQTTWGFGCRYQRTGGAGTYHDVDLSYVAIWHEALTSTDATVLSKGFHPFAVKPTTLQRLFWFYGEGSTQDPELIASDHAVVTVGTAKGTDSPPLIMPSRQQIFAPSAAASGTILPLLNQYYA